MANPTSPAPDPGNHSLPPARAWLYLGTLILGYIGVYACRKNLSVAIPSLQADFKVSRSEIGVIASYSTIAYAVGKFVFGPLVDRFGGRISFLLSLGCVAVFAAAGAFSGSIASLTLLYSLNRFTGAAAWGAMVKQVPDWFPTQKLPFAMAALSLSFVFGGVIATLLAGQIAHLTGNNWHMVMGLPSILLLALIGIAALILPNATAPTHSAATPSASRFEFSKVPSLFAVRQFWVVCALSFTLTLLRETFNTWTVDFFLTEGGKEMSSRIAAFLSTPFDLIGALGILFIGWLFGRIQPATRSKGLFVILSLLAAMLYFLPYFFKSGLWVISIAIAMIGFLTYGPYSLLSGILAVEIKGKSFVSTVACIVDGVGYAAGFLAGKQFGRIVDKGGYKLGFELLAILAAVSAVLCLFLYPGNRSNSNDSNQTA